MDIEEHGGECCGVSHIYNFGPWSERDEQHLADMMADCLREWEEDEERKPSHLFEIVLTDGQLMNGWPAALKRLGFRHVARWYNSNSCNYCNMFVWNRKARIKAPWKN